MNFCSNNSGRQTEEFAAYCSWFCHKIGIKINFTLTAGNLGM